MSKMGRPTIDDPKSRIVVFRLSEGQYARLKDYAGAQNQTITDVISEKLWKIISDDQEQ